MKITVIGGGAHRVLGIMRGAMALPGVRDEGSIHLRDLNQERVEVMQGTDVVGVPWQEYLAGRLLCTGGSRHLS